MTKKDVFELIAHIAETASLYDDDEEVDLSRPFTTQSGCRVEINWD